MATDAADQIGYLLVVVVVVVVFNFVSPCCVCVIEFKSSGRSQRRSL